MYIIPLAYVHVHCLYMLSIGNWIVFMKQKYKLSRESAVRLHQRFRLAIADTFQSDEFTQFTFLG